MRLAWSVWALSALYLAAAPRSARAEVLERVVAVVNDEAIFLSELRARAVPFLDQAFVGVGEAQRLARLQSLYDQLLTQMVSETLLEQEAQKLQLRVSNDEVARAIESVRAQSDLAEDEFWDALGQQGISRAQYRAEIRRQLLYNRLLNLRVRGRINFTEEDVRRRYEQLVRESEGEEELHLAQVFFPVPPDASTSDVETVRARVEEAKRRMDAEGFSEVAAEFGGGDLGWLRRRDLPEALYAVVSRLSVEEISEPIRGSAGFHVLQVLGRRQGQEELPSFAEMRKKLEQQMLEREMQRQQQTFLSELRRRAVIQRRL